MRKNKPGPFFENNTMESHQNRIINEIESFPQYKETVFNYGFILKKGHVELGKEFPFYGNWSVKTICQYSLYHHFKQSVYTHDAEKHSIALVGHAYNPFDKKIDENEILSCLSEAYQESIDAFTGYLNELTGVFSIFIVDENNLYGFCDYFSMQSLYYGISSNKEPVLYSHSALAGMIENFITNDYVAKLKGYKYYPLYGEGLPYDITEYNELLQLLPNTYARFDGQCFTKTRFYPTKNLRVARSDEEYAACVDHCSEILQTSMKLVSEKFPDAAISMTGGTDSKTTLAATNGVYDKFKYFSYNSQHAELVDCQAAKEICDSLTKDGESLQHVQHDIPSNQEEYPEYEVVKSILFVNGNRVKINHNDIMKRIYFFRDNSFEMEVKSWVSEVGRAFYYKKYGLGKLPKKCKAKHLTLMSRIFLCNRWLYFQTNKVNQRYLDELGGKPQAFGYDWSDIFFIEHRYGRWGSGVITNEHKFAYNVTIPHNNRLLGDLLLSVPLDKRIKDKTNFDIMEKLDQRVCDMNVHVINYHHGKKRMLIDRAYFLINSMLPF